MAHCLGPAPSHHFCPGTSKRLSGAQGCAVNRHVPSAQSRTFVSALLLTVAVTFVDAGGAQTQRLFSFHSNAWLNLHHFMRSAARGRPAPETLSEDERKLWVEGVAFYKPYTSRDLLFDQGMVDIKNALRGAEGKRDLAGIGIDAELRAMLERLMPLYQKHAWPQNDRDNRAWIAAAQPLVDRHGAAISQAMVRVYDSTWPGSPVTVDLTMTAGAVGAYTSENPTHVTIASTDRGYQGHAALEMLFHEASHSSISNLYECVTEAAARQKIDVPRQLWHGVLFYTAGELTARELRAHGIAYTPYADEQLYANLCGAGCREKIARHWTPRIDGQQSIADALAALVGEFR